MEADNFVDMLQQLSPQEDFDGCGERGITPSGRCFIAELVSRRFTCSSSQFPLTSKPILAPASASASAHAHTPAQPHVPPVDPRSLLLIDLSALIDALEREADTQPALDHRLVDPRWSIRVIVCWQRPQAPTLSAAARQASATRCAADCCRARLRAKANGGATART